MQTGRRKYPNLRVILTSITIILFSVYTLNNSIERLSIINNNKNIFSIISIFISLFTILGLLLRNKNIIKLLSKENFNKVIYIINCIFLYVFVLEFVIMPFIQGFITASGLTKIPDKNDFIGSVAFIIINDGHLFIKGLLITLQLSLLGTIIGFFIALVFVIIRTLPISKKDTELLAFIKNMGIKFVKSYVNIFRGTPMMVQAIIIYYLLPILISKWFNISTDSVEKVMTITISGIIIVSLNTAAYLTEVLRGGVESISKGQLEAARSLGFTYWKSLIYIIIPQAIKNSLPSIINEFIINIKDTSVLNVIGVAELFFRAQDIKHKYFRSYEQFIIAGLIYLIVTLSVSKLLVYIEKSLSLKETPLPSAN